MTKNNKIMKLKSLFLVVALLSTTILSAQSQQEMVSQAKAMGVSEAQINQALASQQQQSQGVGANSSSDRARVNEQQVVDVNYLAENLPVDSLKLSPESSVFGRDIFTNKNLTFSPNYNIPTPKDYTLGAGDEIKIDIWGNSEFTMSQKISPDGRVFIDNLGPITLSGLTVNQAEAKVKRELSNIFKGLSDGTNSMSLSLGQIRSIQVNIVGEALTPGTYLLPSFSTLFNALYMAGGVNDIGSLRSIDVYRNNKLEANVDIYDYLLNGKSELNLRLEDGDIVIVSPYQSLVSTSGELKRNRIYELKDGETLAQLIDMAGSFKGGAYRKSVSVERKDGDFFTINTVKESDFNSFQMLDGDSIVVKGVANRYDNRIELSGAVWYPGTYELKGNISTVKELIEEAGGLKGDEFAGRAYIIRRNPDFTESVVAVAIKDIMSGGAADVALMADDRVVVPSIFDLREEYVVKVKGAVNTPKDALMYRNNMTVEDAIVMTGGLSESAAEVRVDIARRVKNPTADSTPESIVEVLEVQLNENLKIASTGEPLYLEPFDEVYVRRSPGYREQESVIVGGEVLFKGDYVLKSVNSRLSDVLADAGGVTNAGYTKGAALIRVANEVDRQRANTVLKIIQSGDSRDSVSLETLDIERYTVGIDLDAALANPGGVEDVILQDGDIIYIPKMQSTVKISGAVLYPNSTAFQQKMSVKDCIEQAGGYSTTARKRPIVIYMNGKVAITKRVFFVKKYPKIEPGCEVLVANKRSREKMSAGEIMSLATSSTSMAALVAALISAF